MHMHIFIAMFKQKLNILNSIMSGLSLQITFVFCYIVCQPDERKEVKPELVSLDKETNRYLSGITGSPECSSQIAAMLKSSFQHIFWMQQVEAAKKARLAICPGVCI